MEKVSIVNECKIIQLCVKEVNIVIRKIPKEILESQKKHWIDIEHIVKNKEQQNEILSAIQKHCKTPCSFDSFEIIEVIVDPLQRIYRKK